MAYPFPPDIAERLQAQMNTGQYSTEDDVLREAIDAMERRQRSLHALQAMVLEADEDIAAGRVGKFDAVETKRAVRERLAQHGVTY